MPKKAKKSPVSSQTKRTKSLAASYAALFKPNPDAIESIEAAPFQRTMLQFVPSFTTDGVDREPVLVGFEDARMARHS